MVADIHFGYHIYYFNYAFRYCLFKKEKLILVVFSFHHCEQVSFFINNRTKLTKTLGCGDSQITSYISVIFKMNCSIPKVGSIKTFVEVQSFYLKDDERSDHFFLSCYFNVLVVFFFQSGELSILSCVH